MAARRFASTKGLVVLWPRIKPPGPNVPASHLSSAQITELLCAIREEGRDDPILYPRTARRRMLCRLARRAGTAAVFHFLEREDPNVLRRQLDQRDHDVSYAQWHAFLLRNWPEEYRSRRDRAERFAGVGLVESLPGLPGKVEEMAMRQTLDCALFSPSVDPRWEQHDEVGLPADPGRNGRVLRALQLFHKGERVEPRHRKPHVGKPPLRLWSYEGKQTLAATKSEARAAFKRALGLARLPVGAKVVLLLER